MDAARNRRQDTSPPRREPDGGEAGPSMRAGFAHSEQPNPHTQRGFQILRRHPEVRRYFKPYPLTALCIGGVVLLQLVMAWLVHGLGWPLVLVAAYGIGAVTSHALFVLVHDAGHNLIFRA